MVLNSVADTAP